MPTNLKFSNVSYVGLISQTLISNMSGPNVDFVRILERLQNILAITDNTSWFVLFAQCVVFRLVNANVRGAVHR